MTMIALVAHQGGWDEIGMIGAPLLIFGLLLRRANKRAKAAQAELDESV